MYKFQQTVSDEVLSKIKSKDWYRHGIYLHVPLFVSVSYKALNKFDFKREEVEMEVSNIIDFNGQAFITQSEHDRNRITFERKIAEDENYLERYISLYEEDNRALLEYADSISGRDFKNLSSNELADILKDFCQRTASLSHWLWSMEFLNPAIDRLTFEKLKKWWPNWNVQQINDCIFSISHFPKKLPFQEEQEELMEYAKYENPDVLKRLAKKYEWFGLYVWVGKPLTLEGYTERANRILANKGRVEKEVSERNREIEKAQKFIDSIDIPEAKRFLKTIQELIYLKTYRLDIYTLSWWKVLPLIDEILKRLKISQSDYLYLNVDEIDLLLRKEEVFNEDINLRKNTAVVRLDNEVMYFLGQAAEKIRDILLPNKVDSLKELKGKTGYKGIVRGKVKILFTAKDIPKLEKGDILVANLTDPTFNPAFEKISGVITDEGGILCHSAIMAREFKIPCIVNTKIATQVLKDGDLVEVDADNGVVRILEKRQN